MIGEHGWSKTAWLFLFLLPGVGGLLIFTVLPILASFVLAFFAWDLLTPPQFVGLQNYADIVGDKEFWAALTHTLTFIAGYLPLVIVAGLGMALAMNVAIRGIGFLRTLFFFPVVSSWVAVALLWSWLFNPKYGLVNYLLSLVGITGPGWLFDPQWAMPAIILTSVWKDLGFVLVLFLAGLQSIPLDYTEAAALDGAGRIGQLRHITLPLLAPTTFFVLIISLINSFQVFDQVWVMTGGGPAGATTVLVERIVRHAFRYGEMGYAAALSWVLFFLVFAATIVQFRVQRMGNFDV
jgi:multiple sugar transport system permease protein